RRARDRAAPPGLPAPRRRPEDDPSAGRQAARRDVGGPRYTPIPTGKPRKRGNTMTIDIAVRNFRGCADARLTCAPIALIGGLNAVGKTSIAQAVGAALSGNTLPVAGLRANAAGVLVRTGATTGTVEVGNQNGSVTVEWPAARHT